MKLSAWGANSHGQLGLGVINEQVANPTIVPQIPFCGRIKQISCGGGHTLLLDDKGSLYSCGWNLKQQLGIGEEKLLATFKRVWNLSGIVFINVATGWDFSCGVTDDKFLFVWGSNSHGQLGLPKTHFADVQKPIKLQVNASMVSMGLRHTAVVNSKEEVWVTGSGKQGQLGLGEEILFSDRFTKVPNICGISHITCGQNHTVAWCPVEQSLYMWGDNKYGQLLQYSNNKGIKMEKKNLYVPHKVQINVKHKIKKLLSGWTNLLMFLEDGTILTWGRNNYSQLGTEEHFSGEMFHIKLPNKTGIKDVAIGSEHTICLGEDNTLWAWGWNEHANTGTSSKDIVSVPTLVPLDFDPKETITQIYAGGAHNFIVSEDDNGASNCDNINHKF